MCISGCLHIVLNVSLVIGILFTLIALFTPQWRSQTINMSSVANGVTTTSSAMQSMGAAISNCVSAGTSSNSTSSAMTSITSCLGLTNAPGYQKAAVAFLCMTIILSVITFALSCIACVACCCGKIFMKPLPFLLAACCLFNVIAVICYGVGTGNDFNTMIASMQNATATSGASGTSAAVTGSNNIGYSMWLAIFSIAVFFADAILAVLLNCMSKVTPML